MLLFADTAAENAGWIATGVTALTGITSNLFQWLTARDKVRFDAAPLQKEIADLKGELAMERQTCQEHLGELAARLAKLEARLEADREKAAAVKEKLEAEVERQKDLKHEINNRLAQVQLELSILNPNATTIRPVGDGSGTLPKPPDKPADPRPF